VTTGRKPRTIEDRRASGEPVTVLPIVVGGRPTQHELERAPVGLDRWAKQAWREVAKLLVDAKLIDRVDRQALEGYALHVGRARALREAIEWEHDEVGRRVRHKTLEEQFMARTARGFTSNPLLSQEREAWKEARMMGEQLGLNPVGRTRMTGKQKKPTGLAGLTADLPRPRLAAVGEPE
jgi:P27 family predicted phage terminase small subunit